MRILQIILCLPVWAILLPAAGWCMDHALEALENASDNPLFEFIVIPIGGLIVSILIPTVFLSVGIFAWSAVGWLLGIEM